MATNDNIIDKLKYIGIDLNSIPEHIKDFRRLDYRPSKYNDEHLYKIYKYINIKDIQILLTKANRLSDITEKYKKAVPLYEYLQPDTEENIARHTKFLSMVENINIQKIEEIESEQKALSKKIPFKVKYQKDYLWQIYYSEYTNEYFMMVTTEDLDHSAFFYLLKKQIEKSNDKIFVPISYTNYNEEYLTKTQIADIENYLWIFTKEWPLVYEVYNKNEELSLQITGKTYVYDDIQSDYKIILNNKEDSIKFYKLLKALFIMQTELPNHYSFETAINEKGSLEFKLNNKKIIYEILSSIIKEEYIKADEEKVKLIEEKLELEKELDTLQKESVKLEKEYLDKEKQISTFLECKKTFFGRVKYFFKYKKVNLGKQDEKNEKTQDIKIIRLNKYGEIKSNYTLDELIEIYKQIDKENARVKNLSLDIKAIKQKNINLQSKVKNAKLYIEEINKHKKSIFEFWKFTNKDNVAELPQGEVKEESKPKLKKVFNYELDFEDLGNQFDKIQSQLLTKKELDSIYLLTTDLIKDVNEIAKENYILESRLEELKESAAKENLMLEKDGFDIFGGISYDNKLQTLANKKHRESKKELFKVLDINKNTTIEMYIELIKEIINNVNSAMEKIKNPISLPIYKIDVEDIKENIYNIFSLKGSQELAEIENIAEKCTLYKINLKENMPTIALSNIVYYDNINKTLPIGMNVTEKLILNNNLYKLEKTSKKDINVVLYKETDNELGDIKIKKVKVEEYDINFKDTN